MRLVRFLYHYTKVCFYLLKQFTMFSSFKGTYQRNRCTLKNNIESHIFIFYRAPCQISLSLHQRLNLIYLHSLQCYLLTKVGSYQRNRCTFKNNIKSHIFIVYSAPCLFLSLHQSLCFTVSHSLQFFLLPKLPIKEIGALSIKMSNLTVYFILQCAL